MLDSAYEKEVITVHSTSCILSPALPESRFAESSAPDPARSRSFAEVFYELALGEGRHVSAKVREFVAIASHGTRLTKNIASGSRTL